MWEGEIRPRDLGGGNCRTYQTEVTKKGNHRALSGKGVLIQAHRARMKKGVGLWCVAETPSRGVLERCGVMVEAS